MPGGMVMSIKHGLPTSEQMMMPFDREFLEILPLFKKGFRGVDEMGVLQGEVLRMKLRSAENVAVLDVGSADGEWLKKSMAVVWNPQDFPQAKFTAVEPITDNPNLEGFCTGKGVRWIRSRIEESSLESESCDIVTSTHTAYYYYNPSLVHEELDRVLKPEGLLIVTLVSQFCVLNLLTNALLSPHKQEALNAEEYMAMMRKLQIFQLEKAVAFSGGTMDHAFYADSPDNMRALAYVLARHRLTRQQFEDSLNAFSTALNKYQGEERRNLVMFYRKRARASATGSQVQDSQRYQRRRRLEVEISELRSEVLQMFWPGDKRDVIRGYVEAFATEARKESLAKRAFLNDMARLLVGDIKKEGGPLNDVLRRLDLIMALTSEE